MSIEDAAIVAVWSVLFVAIVALATRYRFARGLDRPDPQPLRLDPTDYDFDGPVIDMEPILETA